MSSRSVPRNHLLCRSLQETEIFGGPKPGLKIPSWLYPNNQTWALAVLPPVSHKFGESCVLYVFHEIAFHLLKGPIANSKQKSGNK